MPTPDRYLRAVDKAKRAMLLTALKLYPSYRGAAKWLGVSTSTVWRDCQRLGISLKTTVVGGV